MNKTIITISRQYGSGGREIGRRLAERLGIPYHDKELIILAAERSGYARSLFEEADQKASNSMIFSLMRAGSMVNSYDLPLNDKIYLIQSGVIQQVARQGSCVIVGRCADYILQEREDCFHVFITGALPDRANRVVTEHEIAPSAAEGHVKERDRKRSSYYKHITDQAWGMAANYDLCLNSSKLGIDRCVDLILGAVDMGRLLGLQRISDS